MDKGATFVRQLRHVRGRTSVGGVFADALYQCITTSSENYKKCMHYPQGIFSFLKVHNALPLSKQHTLFLLDW